MSSNPKPINNRYYLMRHGESFAKRNGLIVSSEQNALSDFGLTSRGSEQVMQAALATRLSRETIIVTSDYRRALETAEIMKSVIDTVADITIDANLRERGFGEYELQDHAFYEDVWRHDIANPGKSQNGVESVENTLDRGLKVISRLEQYYIGKTILLVGHGDVLQILRAHYRNINPRFHRSLSALANAQIRCLNKLEVASKYTA